MIRRVAYSRQGLKPWRYSRDRVETGGSGADARQGLKPLALQLNRAETGCVAL